jgi:hypothetical protein
MHGSIVLISNLTVFLLLLIEIFRQYYEGDAICGCLFTMRNRKAYR